MAASRAGADGKSLEDKLGIGPDTVHVLLHPPAGFALRGGIAQRNLLPPVDVIVTFHTQRAPLLAEWPKLTAAAEPAGAVWVAWPKPTSGVAAGITEDTLRADLLPTGWVDNKTCSIDATWSALRFVQRVERRRPRDRARR
jgi:hypothetical protein